MRASLHLQSSTGAHDAVRGGANGVVRNAARDSAQESAQTSRTRAASSTSTADPAGDQSDSSSSPVKDDDSKFDFHSVLKKYRSSSDSSDADESDSDSGDTDSQDSSKTPDSARALSVPVHAFVSMHEVLPLIAQNPFSAIPDVPASLYTANTEADSAEETSEASDEPAPQIEQRSAPAPTVDASDAPSTSSSAPVAFAAKLTPSSSESSAPAPAQQPQQASSNQASNPAPQKQPAASSIATDDSDPAPVKAAADTAALDKIVKTDAAASSTPQSDVPAKRDTATPNVTAAARMEPLVEAPAAPAGSNHDITVRIPDAAERAVDVRFVERAGEVHVSVRSGDADTAQSLRSGLNDFVSRMDHAGIRAEVWRPGADASASQNNSQNQSSSDPREQKRNQSAAEDQEDQQQPSKPKWVEALEKAANQAA